MLATRSILNDLKNNEKVTINDAKEGFSSEQVRSMAAAIRQNPKLKTLNFSSHCKFQSQDDVKLLVEAMIFSKKLGNAILPREYYSDEQAKKIFANKNRIIQTYDLLWKEYEKVRALRQSGADIDEIRGIKSNIGVYWKSFELIKSTCGNAVFFDYKADLEASFKEEISYLSTIKDHIPGLPVSVEELAKSPEKPQASNNNNNVPSSTTTILQHTLVVASSPDLPALNIERAGNALKITGFNSVNDANKDDVKRGIKEGITALEFISSNVECSYIEDLLAGFPETKMDLKFVDSTIVGDKSDRNKSISLHSLAFQRCNVDKISFCRLVEAEGLSQVAIDKPFLLLKWGIINLIERKNKIRFVFSYAEGFLYTRIAHIKSAINIMAFLEEISPYIVGISNDKVEESCSGLLAYLEKLSYQDVEMLPLKIQSSQLKIEGMELIKAKFKLLRDIMDTICIDDSAFAFISKKFYEEYQAALKCVLDHISEKCEDEKKNIKQIGASPAHDAIYTNLRIIVNLNKQYMTILNKYKKEDLYKLGFEWLSEKAISHVETDCYIHVSVFASSSDFYIPLTQRLSLIALIPKESSHFETAKAILLDILQTQLKECYAGEKVKSKALTTLDESINKASDVNAILQAIDVFTKPLLDNAPKSKSPLKPVFYKEKKQKLKSMAEELASIKARVESIMAPPQSSNTLDNVM